MYLSNKKFMSLRVEAEHSRMATHDNVVDFSKTTDNLRSKYSSFYIHLKVCGETLKRSLNLFFFN